MQNFVYHISGKFGRGKVWQIYFLQAFGKKVWQLNRSARRILIVSTNLDGFSLANHRLFTELFPPIKLSHYMVVGMSGSNMFSESEWMQRLARKSLANQ